MTPPVGPKDGKCSSSFATFFEMLFDFRGVNQSTDIAKGVSIVDRSAEA